MQSLEIVELETSVSAPDRLPKKGRVVVLAPHGDAAAVSLSGVSAAPRQRVWEMDVTRWVRYVIVPFPNQPIGEGAKWRRTWVDPVMTGRVTQVSEYSLVSLEGAAAVIDVKTVIKARDRAERGDATVEARLWLRTDRREVPKVESTQEGTLTIEDPRGPIEGVSSSSLKIEATAP